MSQPDGSVVISTKIDDSNIEQAFERIKNDAKSLGLSCEKAGEQIAKAFDGTDIAKPITDAASRVQDALEGVAITLYDPDQDSGHYVQTAEEIRNSYHYATDEIKAFVDEYADGMDTAEQGTSELRAALEQAKAEVKALEEQGFFWDDAVYQKAQKNLYNIRADIAQMRKETLQGEPPANPFGLDTISGKVREAQLELERLSAAGKSLGDAEYDAAFKNLASLKAEMRQYAAELSKTPEQYAREEAAAAKAAAAVQREADRKLKAEKSASQKAIRQTEKEYSAKQKAMEKSYQEATKGARKFSTRLKRIVSGAFIFSAISSGLRQLTSYFGSALKQNSEFSASLAELKGAFLTAVQPIYNVVAPAIIYFIKLLTVAAQAVSRLFSLLSGKSTSELKNNAEELYNQANATEAVGSAAEKAKKQLAGFDEINRLESNDTSGTGSSGISSTTDIPANFDYEELSPIDLDELIVWSAGTLIGIGAILAFSGVNIPLGIGMMVAGALMLYEEAKENWEELGNTVNETIVNMLELSGIVALVIGAVLAFSGVNLALGVGLMALGATEMATAAALNWGTGKVTLEQAIGAAFGVVGVAFLVIGSLLVFSGVNIPIGIALMAVGAAEIATAAALNWATMKDEIGAIVTFLTGIIAAAALMLGIILAFTGVSLPLAIALIAVGAATLVTQVAPNWNSTVEKLKGTIGVIAAVASAALLVLGIILCATGVAFPLGVALIAAGAAGLVGLASINSDYIAEWVSKCWDAVVKFWDTYIAPVFTMKFWKDLAINAGNGLISGFEGAINGIISAIESMVNWIANALNKISFSFPDWVPNIGGKKYGINIPNVSLSRVSIPRLAQGAVIPGGKEFLAVLGDQKPGQTNVEAPLETIQEAVALVIEDMTNGMMAGFEALLEENQRLRAAVEGIEVGDSTIGQAANRYNQRMAIVKGG